MSCPYFKESYFGICVAQDAIHVPSIDEMERFCFRSWYGTCPNITSQQDTSALAKTGGGKGHKMEAFPFVPGRDKDAV